MSQFEAGLVKTNGTDGSNPKTRLLGGSKTIDYNKQHQVYGLSGNQDSIKGAVDIDAMRASNVTDITPNEVIPKVSLSSPNAAELLKRIDGVQYKNLVKFLHAIDYTKLNQWEGDFCKSMIDKLDKYDEHILLSSKQHEVIRNIYKKHG